MCFDLDNSESDPIKLSNWITSKEALCKKQI